MTPNNPCIDRLSVLITFLFFLNIKDGPNSEYKKAGEGHRFFSILSDVKFKL